jgi:methylated-DNA-[protein]-cysteine S-methyltransferase
MASDAQESYAVWPTAWGAIAALAKGQSITRVILPHYAPGDLDDLVRWEHPNAAKSESPFEAFIELSRAYFNGQKVDFGELDCALPGESSFGGMVLRACRELAHGQTVSYSHLARTIGREDAARAVATALGKNATPLIIPCHRVTYADGRPGGFSAAGGVDLKMRLLALESGVR